VRRSILFVIASLATSPVQAGTYVRVNQLGYESGVSSRAYLMTSSAAPPATFRITNARGAAAFSGPVGAKLGGWGDYTVFALDFAIKPAGMYVISAEDASSPAFPVDTPANLYSAALARALHFYQNQRDGPDFIPSFLRAAPAHLSDRDANVYLTPEIDRDEKLVGDLAATGATIDASGGWFDAGDYLKFVETHSYVVALMLIGVRDFPDQMGAGSSRSDFTAEAKFGLDWLQKMWDDRSRTLYYQVGIGSGNASVTSDHDLWRLPQLDDALGGESPASRYIRHRPVFIAANAGSPVSPNLAGRLAADFALCYRVFHASDPAYADRCLASAEHVFDLAGTSRQGPLLTAAPFGFYGETEWRDDMELGATELYLALAGSKTPHRDPLFYLRAAAHWANLYVKQPAAGRDPLNLYDVGGLAHFELYRALAQAADPAGLEISRTGLVAALREMLDPSAKTAAGDPFEFGYPWSKGDTPAHGAGLSVMAAEYAFAARSEAHDRFSRRWMGNILGANAWGASFIVGDGGTFPKCIHHQIANLAGSLDGTPPLLDGALVEGPNSRGITGGSAGMLACPPGGRSRFAAFDGNGAVFVDTTQSYVTVEPAIDLTAPSLLMFAWRIAGAPAGMSATQTPRRAREVHRK
jgi:endoglucanase